MVAVRTVLPLLLLLPLLGVLIWFIVGRGLGPVRRLAREVAARSPIHLAGLLPAERGYYTYMGSMTAPPCSEGVLWMVMKTPLTASAQQLAIFSRLYPMNARPVQQADGRLIKESN